MARKTKGHKTKEQKRKERNYEITQWITVVILCALLLLALIRAGVVGTFLYNLQRFLVGSLYWLIVGFIMIWVLITIRMNHTNGYGLKKNPAASVLILAAILLLTSHLGTDPELSGMDILYDFFNRWKTFFTGTPDHVGGGIIGAVLCAFTSLLFGRKGIPIVVAVLFLIAALLMVSLDVYKKAAASVVSFFALPEREDEEEEEPEPEVKEPKNLWKMLSEVRPGEKEEEIARETVKKAEQRLPERDEHSASLINLNEEDPDKKVLEVYLPGTVMSSPGSKSIFINADDVKDNLYEEPVPETEITEELPVMKEEVKPVPDVQEEGEVKPQPKQQRTAPARKDFKNYRVPNPFRLLAQKPVTRSDEANRMAAVEKGELLIRVLKNFDIEAQLVDTHIGPSVTQFEIKPDANVKVSRIMALTDTIKMQLAVKDIRIEAPIPGRPAVGIEVPNPESTPVMMREIISRIPEKERNSPLLFAVGKDLLGEPVFCRLDKMPHLLIAGATGSGKSVCMNSIITSLLLRTKPDEVKMLLIDPKKVEFTPYRQIPHLIGPVINDANQASNALKVIVKIMDERYDAFSKAGARNITIYNEKVKQQGGRPNEDGSPAPKPFPYIVVIIDELADLMVVAGKEVESSIQRITQLARAAGIHLIVATQRPSTDVITGIIKANIPSRIAFSVSSGIDSRTILDHVGAERLLGNGDMLYMPIGQSGARRVQGVFVSDEEVMRITEATSKQAVPMYDDAFVLLEGINDGTGVGGISEVEADPLFQEVKKFVIESKKASTSLLQRRFGIGYNRAARMIDELERAGVIGPAQGSKPREVFAKKEE